MRHLNLEAAKMVKYGGVSESQALAMITINPARELGLDGRLGSIEVGKDADIVLFNGHPFDAFSRCELALIDGEVFFQRHEPGGGFGVRPGEHTAMPAATESVRNRSIEIAAQPKNLFALIGANLHPVSGPEIKGGTLVIAGGKIAAIGPAGTPIPPEAQTIEMSGLDIWPGMVDAGSTIGLFEIGSLTETQDSADAAQFQPELRSSTALHPDSEHIPVTRANGILTSFVEPTGGTISGQGCLIDLNGWVPRELVIADQVALDVTIPTYIARTPESRRPGPGLERPGQGPGGAQGANAARERRKERLEKIKELFRKAIAYDTVVAKARDRGDAPPAPDPRLEALAPYARGQKPVILHAEQQVEILDALDLIRELKLKGVISGGSEAWKVADALKQAKVPVLVGGTLKLPRHDYDPYDADVCQPGEAARGRRDRGHPFQGGRLQQRDGRAQPSLRGGHGGCLRLARGGRAQGRHPDAGSDPGSRRSGGLARSRQARQPGRHGGPPPPADDARTGPLHRRRAAPAREPPHAALRQVPPPARRGPSRPGPAGNRTGPDEHYRFRFR